MIEIAVSGATGRMGRRVLALAQADPRFRIAAALCHAEDPLCGQSMEVEGMTYVPCVEFPANASAVIDFSVPAGTMAMAAECASRRIPLVSGTTGLIDAQHARLGALAASAPMLHAANFSVGVNILTALAARLALQLGEGFDIEIIESHHRAKVDAPSGTALSLLESIVSATGRDRKADVAYGREGRTGARPGRQIGVHAVRMGSIVGRHSVHYASMSEVLTISHEASSRDVFAAGALRAAAWLIGKPPRLYTMADVLGLVDP